MTLPAFSALPSTESVTSYSFSARLLAPTLIWMLIWGGCGCGANEVGAFGFSNDRSLVYCASTFNWGGAPTSGGAPLPLVMKISPGASKKGRLSGRVANIALPRSTRMTVSLTLVAGTLLAGLGYPLVRMSEIDGLRGQQAYILNN